MYATDDDEDPGFTTYQGSPRQATAADVAEWSDCSDVQGADDFNHLVAGEWYCYYETEDGEPALGVEATGDFPDCGPWGARVVPCMTTLRRGDPIPGIGLLNGGADPCFDGRTSSYRDTRGGGSRDYGDWIYKFALPAGLSHRADDDEAWAGKSQVTVDDLGNIAMKVFKVVKAGTSGRTKADADTVRDTGFVFKLSDIKPRKSEESTRWQDHPLTIEVATWFNDPTLHEFDCPQST